MAISTNITVDKTLKETEQLFLAQGDFIKSGKTDRKCPRCGSDLVYEYGSWGEMTHCEDPSCIGIAGRGI
jgi:ssDNA-binding Zn-finger/Zn-ribbon topoisomerase 1